jgi:hypothetical protein
VNILIRNNSSSQIFALGITSGYPFRNYRVVNNIAPGCACVTRLISYSHNLWTSSKPCGTTDRVGDPRFVDASQGGLPRARRLAGDRAGRPDVLPVRRLRAHQAAGRGGA